MLSSVASRGQVGIDGIDPIPAGGLEADHHSEIDPARSLGGSMVGLEGGVRVRDGQP